MNSSTFDNPGNTSVPVPPPRVQSFVNRPQLGSLRTKDFSGCVLPNIYKWFPEDQLGKIF